MVLRNNDLKQKTGKVFQLYIENIETFFNTENLPSYRHCLRYLVLISIDLFDPEMY